MKRSVAVLLQLSLAVGRQRQSPNQGDHWRKTSWVPEMMYSNAIVMYKLTLTPTSVHV